MVWVPDRGRARRWVHPVKLPHLGPTHFKVKKIVILEKSRKCWGFIENVRGHKSSAFWPAFQRFMPRSAKIRGIRENRNFWSKKDHFGPDIAIFRVQKIAIFENAGDSSKMFGDIKVAHFDPLSNGICPVPWKSVVFEKIAIFGPKRTFWARLRGAKNRDFQKI